MTSDDASNAMTIDQLVGSNIKALRKNAELSLREAADLMTIWHYEPWSYERLRRREEATTPVTVAEMHAFANLYGVSLFRLLQRPRGVEFLQINGLLIRAEDYQFDYMFDVDGRTGEAWRVMLADREAIVARRALKKANSGKPFAPGLFDDTPSKNDLKSVAEALQPAAELIRQAAERGPEDGDDQED